MREVTVDQNSMCPVGGEGEKEMTEMSTSASAGALFPLDIFDGEKESKGLPYSVIFDCVFSDVFRFHFDVQATLTG